ncbi:MAG: ceramidase domain-containing protein [Alphaproteobacteria bacterium]|nr:ceramidase domain-containing protein [Alphaproteobacteria bacterium]MBP9878239.1 ceramidase domain-containing protein [Alphaproteobacteria bacterium]
MFESGFNFTYCEHIELFGIAQPLNVLSNLVFLFVACLVVRPYNGASWMPFVFQIKGPKQFRKLVQETFWILLLIMVGSFIWHGTEKPGTLWLDIGAIFAFLVWYLWYVLKQYPLKLLHRVFLLMIFIVIDLILTDTLDNHIPLKSGAFVLPALVFITMPQLFAFAEKVRKIQFSGLLLLAAIVFRVVDLQFCEVTGIGTHWLWHVLTGLSLYYPLKSLLKAYAPDSK